MKIIVTAAGGPSGLCFAHSLRKIPSVRLTGINAERDPSAEKFFHAFYQVPLASHPEYLDAVRSIALREGADYIIPFVDEEVLLLSAVRDTLPCKVLVSPFETVAITGNKRRTYERLAKYLPRRFDKSDVRAFPIFAKPHVGRGGRGIAVIRNEGDLTPYSDATHIFQDLLQPPEVSVDTLFDFDGNLILAVPRLRAKIDQGISVSGVVFHDAALHAVVMEIAKLLKFEGPVNFQFMHGSDGFILTEINARGSGGMGITVHAGADIPKFCLELMEKGSVRAVPDFIEGSYPNFDEVIERQRRKLQQQPTP